MPHGPDRVSAAVLVPVDSPRASLMVWAACGLLGILGTVCSAEVGTLVPKCGGRVVSFIYILPLRGSFSAFLVTQTGS